MQNHATALGWIRSHRRFAAIIVAIALAFTILAALAAPGFDGDGSVAADDGSMVVAGLSWSNMMTPGDLGGGATTNGLSWSRF